MERLEYDSYGGPDLVHMSSFTLSAPQAGEVVVRVAAASINPMDWKIRNGDVKVMTGSKFPRALGTDFAGTVESVGPNVTRFKPGDEVVGTVTMKASGAFAPMLVTSQNLVVKKPAGLSFAAAASLPIAGVTAWQALVKSAGLKSGQRLFINGATGSVGRAAIAIARDIGADVVGRVGSKSVSSGPSLGLSLALDYTLPIPPALAGAFDVVFDANGSLSAREGNSLARRGGLIIDIAPTRSKFLRALVSRSRKVVFSDLKAPHLQQVIDLAIAGKLQIPVVKIISLSEAPGVLASLEQGARLDGKAVIAF